MPLNTSQCALFNDYLGRRPYNWDQRIARDRKPVSYIYTGMYRTQTWENYTNTTHLHERTYVTRPNDPNLWSQFLIDPCLSTPCDTPRKYICHGVDQLRYEEFTQDYMTPVFCLDQLNSIEEGMAKMAQIAEGYQELPELITSDFLRLLVLRRAGSQALNNSGLYICGPQDSQGNPTAIDVSDNMFAVSQGGIVGTNNSLLINLNANGGLTAIGITTTALLMAAMGQLTMEYLNGFQEDLAAQGYHDKEWLVEGKFSMTIDATARRRMLVANPALSHMYVSADFAKGGSFYGYGFSGGCGDYLFKEDKNQMRFRFRSDLDGKDLTGAALANSIWIEQVWPYQNVAATYGLKPVYSNAWRNAPIRMYHIYNREARTTYVGDITSINDQMKFGLARSFMGKWKWYSPDFFRATDPNTGVVCDYPNDKHNKGYWLGEYRMGIKTVFPEIERVILALGEAQPNVRVPRTVTPLSAPYNTADYQALLAYCSECGEYTPPAFSLPIED